MGCCRRPQYGVVFDRTRKHDPNCFGIAFENLRQQLGSAHSRHTHVGDDDVEFTRCQLPQSILSAGTEFDLPLRTKAVERSLQPIQNVLFIVNKQRTL